MLGFAAYVFEIFKFEENDPLRVTPNNGKYKKQKQNTTLCKFKKCQNYFWGIFLKIETFDFCEK